ncbi:helix-turn-helix domain-containing protein [Bifidobacterium longum]|uniref:helix-turn-helix domain-containing protein n=1 Tax=Bifidobacterium longum TaxID=216816 RepID=UPI0021AF9A0C|nr:helix-turn-helix domain-containing protein [Bifidobacterium longum]
MSIELVARAKKTRLHGDSTAKLLLIVLADYANDEGMAWPSVKTMAEETEKSERSIQLLLRKLEQMRLIRKGDQKLVAKYAKGRRPTVYKLFPTAKKSETPVNATVERGETHFTPETGYTGETGFTPRVKPTSPHGCNPLHPTGETHFVSGVKPTSPKPSQEPSIEPSRESTRANKTDTTRLQALANLTPDQSHRQLADEIGLDLDAELAKFRDHAIAGGHLPADPAAAFRNWLRRGRELGLGNTNRTEPALAGGFAHPTPPPRKPHRHSYGCTHVLNLLNRDAPDNDPLALRAAELLNQGKTETEALAALGLMKDDLEEIA